MKTSLLTFTVLFMVAVASSTIGSIFTPSTASAMLAKCYNRSFSTTTNSNDYCVRYIQRILNSDIALQNANNNAGSCNNIKYWYGAYLSVDGRFGSKTKSAVQTLQNARCLSADGVVGYYTWRALCNTAFSQYKDPRSWMFMDAYNAAIDAGCPYL